MDAYLERLIVSSIGSSWTRLYDSVSCLRSNRRRNCLPNVRIFLSSNTIHREYCNPKCCKYDYNNGLPHSDRNHLHKLLMIHKAWSAIDDTDRTSFVLPTIARSRIHLLEWHERSRYCSSLFR